MTGPAVKEAREALETPLGEPGSGRVRYAAAMHLYQIGQMDAETLERYRICCKLDHEDPNSVKP
ncbi:MAG: hypothetical protein AAGF59_04235 [Pseudomonadota bacterium]